MKNKKVEPLWKKRNHNTVVELKTIIGDILLIYILLILLLKLFVALCSFMLPVNKVLQCVSTLKFSVDDCVIFTSAVGRRRDD